MVSTLPELIDFWPDGYIGHTDSKGLDIGKEFLRNLFMIESSFPIKKVKIFSHFQKPNKNSIVRRVVSHIFLILKSDKISKQKKLHGHQGNRFDLEPSALNIWYTSENIRPPLSENFNIFLSHDLDDYMGKNIYLPIWATRLGSNIEESVKAQDNFLNRRITTVNEKSDICAVISNPEPIRLAFLTELQRHVKVDIYGAFGLPLSDKNSVLSRYKVNICFENDEFPGYVTEKPFESWMNGCIPVWRGIDSGSYLNEEAIINVTKLGFRHSIEQIIHIVNNNSEYLRISSQPILNRGYDFLILQDKIRSQFIHSMN